MTWLSEKIALIIIRWIIWNAVVNFIPAVTKSLENSHFTHMALMDKTTPPQIFSQDRLEDKNYLTEQFNDICSSIDCQLVDLCFGYP